MSDHSILMYSSGGCRNCQRRRQPNDKVLAETVWKWNNFDREEGVCIPSTPLGSTDEIMYVYRPQGKVMFSQVSVILSTIGVMATGSLLILVMARSVRILLQCFLVLLIWSDRMTENSVALTEIGWGSCEVWRKRIHAHYTFQWRNCGGGGARK